MCLKLIKKRIKTPQATLFFIVEWSRMREKGRKNPKHKKTSTEKSKGKVKVGEKR